MDGGGGGLELSAFPNPFVPSEVEGRVSTTLDTNGFCCCGLDFL